MSYLDDITELSIQAQEVISRLAIIQAERSGAGEGSPKLRDQILRFTQLLSQSLNTALTDEQRLKLLTRLVNDARLADVPYYPYPPIEVTVVPTQRYVGDHDSLSNIQGDGFYHISAAQRSRLLSALQPTDLTFGGILGAPEDNVALAAVLAGKEPVISPSGNPAQFLNGNKSFAVVQYSQLGGRPDTLAGFGISASDTLFDGKYLQLGSPLTGLSTISGAQLDASTTVIQAFGRLQNQVNAKESALGNPGSDGEVLASLVDGTRYWTSAPTGSGITGITLSGTRGITGAVVVTSGVADIVAGTNVTGLLKGNGTSISAAVAGTDYESPLIFSTGLSRSVNTITVNDVQNIARLSNLSTNGFVKASAGNGTLIIDTTPYVSLNSTLSGLSITGSTITNANTIISAFGALQNQINGILGGASYQGVWNATVNTPTLTSGVGTKGYYYVVNVAGSTNLDGITDWKVGDWAIFNGVAWNKVDNTDAVSSVNGAIGAVVITATGTSNRIVVTGGSGLTPTFDIGSDVVTLSGTQTLANKQLNSPNLNGASTTGYVWTASDSLGNGSWAAATGAGANAALSNLASVSINTSLIPQTGVDLGGTSAPFKILYLYGAGTFGVNRFAITGTPTAPRTITIPDASGTMTLLGNSSTGSGSVVLDTSPTLTTPVLGVATGTSLTTTGALTSGVASTTAGTLVLRNASNALTQTIRGTGLAASIIYDLPITAPTAGQVLTSTAPSSGVATLSWSSAGSGTVTSVAALTLGTTGTDLSSTVATGTTTPVITLNVPDASATARGVITTGTQTIAGAKTFTGAATFSVNGTAITVSGNGSKTAGSIVLSGGSAPRWIDFGSTGAGAPVIGVGSRSDGTKIVLANTQGAAAVDFGLGVTTTAFWSSVANNGTGFNFEWYGGATLAMSLRGDGQLTLVGAIIGAATQSVFNTVSTNVSAFGAATTLTIGATTGTATIRNAILNLSNASGVLQINSTQVVKSRITGWGAPTATQLRAALTNASTTTDVLQTLSALITDLTTHGLIGA